MALSWTFGNGRRLRKTTLGLRMSGMGASGKFAKLGRIEQKNAKKYHYTDTFGGENVKNGIKIEIGE